MKAAKRMNYPFTVLLIDEHENVRRLENAFHTPDNAFTYGDNQAMKIEGPVEVIVLHTMTRTSVPRYLEELL